MRGLVPYTMMTLGSGVAVVALRQCNVYTLRLYLDQS